MQMTRDLLAIAKFLFSYGDEKDELDGTCRLATVLNASVNFSDELTGTVAEPD